MIHDGSSLIKKILCTSYLNFQVDHYFLMIFFVAT